MNVRIFGAAAEANDSAGRAGTLDIVAFALVLILIILSPFPYGGVTAQEEPRILLLAFSAAVAALIAGGGRIGRITVAAVVPLCLFAAYALFQAAPLAPSTVASVSPKSVEIYASANEVLRAAGDPEPLAPSISLARTATVRGALLALGYAAALVAAALTLVTRRRRRIASLTIVGVAIGHIIWAAATQPDIPRIQGSFANANNFAGYLGIALAVAFAALWNEILTGGDALARIRSRAVRVEKRSIRLLPFVMVWAVLAIGIGLTRSRMGIVATVSATILMVVAGLLHGNASSRRKRLGVAIVAVLAVAIGIAALTTRDLPLLRFLAFDPRDAESDLRVTLWSLSLETWRDFRVFGSGIGTFAEAFRYVQPADVTGLVDQAHSDYIELLVSGGIAGVTIAATGFLTVLILLARAWWRERHREESTAMLCALGATAGILIHGIAEFNLSIPAIPMLLAVVVGMGSAASNARSDGVRGS